MDEQQAMFYLGEVFDAPTGTRINVHVRYPSGFDGLYTSERFTTTWTDSHIKQLLETEVIDAKGGTYEIGYALVERCSLELDGSVSVALLYV